MLTAADMVTFQQQLRQETADVIQQLRTELNETASGRIVMLNSVNTALQNVSANLVASKPCRMSVFPRNWEGCSEKY